MSYPNSGCCRQETTAYTHSTCCQERRSYQYVYGLIGFFAVLLAFAIGLILGAVYYETILPVIAAIIAFIAALAAVGIGIWVFTRRRRC